MDIELDQINVVVRDMEAMAAFYGRLGLSFGGGMAEWAPHHRSSGAQGGLDVDLDSTAFASVWNRGWPGGTGIVLGFRVPEREDVDRRYEELTAAGHTGQQPPYDAFWGSRFAVVADPDGNSVALMSPPDPSRRTPPPAPPPG
jgi:catechol 2,3-dioxygenase-like lactoylglutathione lyase family enzyme